MKARPYQVEALLNFFHELHNRSSALIIMPTGTGKGFVIGQIVLLNPFAGRTMVVVHREEIVFQLASHIEKAIGEAPEIEMASLRALRSNDSNRKRCVVSSIATLCKDHRLEKFNPRDFGTLIIDESHHAPSASYRKTINYFKQNPALKLGGLTATPNRTDKITLGCIYDCVAYNYPILQAIQDGYLVPIDQQYVYINGLDLDSVRVTDGDLNRKEMDAIISRDEIMMGIVDATIKLAKSRKTLLFGTSVYAATLAAEYFCGHEPESAAVLSQRSKREDRREILKKFKNDEFLKRLCNCNLFTEGWDEPSIQVVALARKTKSGLVYSQMVGRGLRPYPSGLIDTVDVVDSADRKKAIATSPKPRATILDFYGNSSRHKLVSMPDILCGDWPDEIIAKVKERLLKKTAVGEIGDVCNELVKEVEEEKEREIRKRSRLIASAQFTATFVDPFCSDDTPVTYEPPSIRGTPPTEKMKKRLASWGIDCDKERINFIQAKKLIDEMIRRHTNGLATYRQCKWLNSQNIDARSWSVEKASVAMELFIDKQVTTLPDLSTNRFSVGMKDGGGAVLFLKDGDTKHRLAHVYADVKSAQEYVVKINKVISEPSLKPESSNE